MASSILRTNTAIRLKDQLLRRYLVNEEPVMAYRHDSTWKMNQRLLHDLNTRQIEMICRLVQYDDSRSGEKAFRKRYAGLLPTGQMADYFIQVIIRELQHG